MNRETIVIPKEWKDYNVLINSLKKNFNIIKSECWYDNPKVRYEDILQRIVDSKYFRLICVESTTDYSVIILSFEEVFPKQITTTIYE